jgi:hypothetical protein
MKTAATKPEYQSRCVYCGDPEVDAHMSCCGERHFEMEAECPDCGGEVYTISTTVAGMESSAPACNNCAWVGDTE